MPIANRILKNTIALTIGSAGQLVGNMILIFYLSRLLQAEGLGIYSTVLAIYHTVALGCQIVNPYIPRELPKDLSQTNRYLIHGSLISGAVALVLMVGLDIVVPFLGYLPQTQTGLYIISFAFVSEAVNHVFFMVFISHQKTKFSSAATVLVAIGRIVFSLLALRLGFGVTTLILIFTAFSYLNLLINFIFLRLYIERPRWEFDWPFMRNMIRELKYFAGLTLLGTLFSQSEVVVLSLIGGETQVGFYSPALKLVTIWSMVPKSYITATFPVLSATFSESRKNAIRLQNSSLKYLMAMALPLAVGLTVTAGPIIPLLLGPGFQESVGVLRLLAWYLPLIFCNMVLYRVLVVRNEQHVVFRLQLISEIIQVLLAVGLVPTLGPRGAAWALLGGNLLYTLATAYYVRRDKTPLPIVQLTWRFALASVVMGLFAWVLTPRLHVLALIPAAAGVYAVMLWMLRAFSADDLALFKRLVSPSRKREYVEPGPSMMERND